MARLIVMVELVLVLVTMGARITPMDDEELDEAELEAEQLLASAGESFEGQRLSTPLLCGHSRVCEPGPEDGLNVTAFFTPGCLNSTTPLGCRAFGKRCCRFCGFREFADIPCPVTRPSAIVDASGDIATEAENPSRGYPASDVTVGGENWCAIAKPVDGWHLKHCAAPTQRLKVLTQNLFHHLFAERHGSGGDAGTAIANSSSSVPFDMLGFQECDDVASVRAGLDQYDALDFGHGVASLWSKEWKQVSSGSREVGEDRREQHYGRRIVGWVRLQHEVSHKVVFFVNFHGPLPVLTGGICGGAGTAYNIAKVIGEHAQAGDGIVLVGDFNSPARSEMLNTMDDLLHRHYQGDAFQGIDNIYSNCPSETVVHRQNLGSGDHEALEIILQI